MQVNWANRAGIAMLLAAGFAVIYAAMRRTMVRTLVERQQAVEQQLNALAETVKTLETRVAEFKKAQEPQPAIASEFEMSAATAPALGPAPVDAEEAAGSADEQITPEMMSVIAASVTAFLGKKVRILSARKLESPRPGLSPWSQQGRVFVQASHNLRSRN